MQPHHSLALDLWPQDNPSILIIPNQHWDSSRKETNRRNKKIIILYLWTFPLFWGWGGGGGGVMGGKLSRLLTDIAPH